jgi:hypothetical protein
VGDEHPNFQQGIVQTESAWSDLLAALDGIPEARIEEPGVVGDWSIRDLLGHIALWDEEGATKVRRLGGGLPVQRIDFQTINDSEALARSGWSAAEAREAMERAHALLIATLVSHPEIDPAEIAIDTWEHYADHAAQIRAWRG